MNDFLCRRCRCPDCHQVALTVTPDTMHCQYCAATFPLQQGRPVLIRHDNELFPIARYLEPPSEGQQRQSLFHRLARYVPSPSVNLYHDSNLQKFAVALAPFTPAYVLVIGAGKQKSHLESVLAAYRHIQPVYSDIDTLATVDLFCDAHELPFVDQVFHGVIATAVLEHVLYPERVVAEIYRVVMDGGLVYSEVPFMQQVHEGAYDFTRYTLSGHRRLFNHFQECTSGLIAGPATALVWAVENFALCFAPNHMLQLCIKTGVRLLFFWLKYLDYLLKDLPQAMDSASATYFLGYKNPSLKTSDKAIVDRYIGAKRLDHL
jgi:hypothetical protein